MRSRNLSSWAEDFDLEDLNDQGNKFNLSFELIEEAHEVMTRSFSRKSKKAKDLKARNECWQ